MTEKHQFETEVKNIVLSLNVSRRIFMFSLLSQTITLPPHFDPHECGIHSEKIKSNKTELENILNKRGSIWMRNNRKKAKKNVCLNLLLGNIQKGTKKIDHFSPVWAQRLEQEGLASWSLRLFMRLLGTNFTFCSSASKNGLYWWTDVRLCSEIGAEFSLKTCWCHWGIRVCRCFSTSWFGIKVIFEPNYRNWYQAGTIKILFSKTFQHE